MSAFSRTVSVCIFAALVFLTLAPRAEAAEPEAKSAETKAQPAAKTKPIYYGGFSLGAGPALDLAPAVKKSGGENALVLGGRFSADYRFARHFGAVLDVSFTSNFDTKNPVGRLQFGAGLRIAFPLASFFELYCTPSAYYEKVTKIDSIGMGFSGGARLSLGRFFLDPNIGLSFPFTYDGKDAADIPLEDILKVQASLLFGVHIGKKAAPKVVKPKAADVVLKDTPKDEKPATDTTSKSGVTIPAEVKFGEGTAGATTQNPPVPDRNRQLVNAGGVVNPAEFTGYRDMNPQASGNAASSGTSSQSFLASSAQRAGPVWTPPVRQDDGKAATAGAPYMVPVEIDDATRRFMGDMTRKYIFYFASDDPYKTNDLIYADANEKAFREIARILKANPDYRLRVTGFVNDTDASDDKEKNVNIPASLRRAAQIASLLEQRGVAKERLVTIGAGSAAPAVSTNDKKLQALNRRVECAIIK